MYINAVDIKVFFTCKIDNERIADELPTVNSANGNRLQIKLRHAMQLSNVYNWQASRLCMHLQWQHNGNIWQHKNSMPTAANIKYMCTASNTITMATKSYHTRVVRTQLQGSRHKRLCLRQPKGSKTEVRHGRIQ